MKLDYCPYLSRKRSEIITADAERFFGSEALSLANHFRQKWENKTGKVVGWMKGHRGREGRRIAMDYIELYSFAAKYRTAVSTATARLAGHFGKAMAYARGSEKSQSWIHDIIERYATEKLRRPNVEYYLADALGLSEAETKLPAFKRALGEVLSFIGRSGLPTYQARMKLELMAALESEKRKKRKRYPKGFEKLPPKRQDSLRFFENANLTERQKQCASLRWEYGLRITDIARRLGLHRKTVQEHLARANAKMKWRETPSKNPTRAGKTPWD